MTKDELIDSMSEFFETFGASLSTTQWSQYWEALQDVNPGDLDEAMADLRKTHKFRNAPLPAEIILAAQIARRRQVAAIPEPSIPPVDDLDGILHDHTIEGLGTFRVRVLPDDHPALTRYACIRCYDSGWVRIMATVPHWLYRGTPEEGILREYSERCHCVATNPVLQRQREASARYASKVNHKSD